jgi:hypothetical protein
MLQVKEERICECGTELLIWYESRVGYRGGRESVVCPKCGKEHDSPARPLKLFAREGNASTSAGL